MESEQHNPHPSFWKSPAGWTFLVAAAHTGHHVEHRAHGF